MPTANDILEGLTFQEIAGDGHCFFRVVSLYCGKEVSELRAIASQIMLDNQETFSGFFDSNESLLDYAKKVAGTNEYADERAIRALQQQLERPIVIIRKDAQPTILDNDFDGEPIFLYYNGVNHYDGFLLNSDANGSEVLNKIRAAIADGIDLKFEPPQMSNNESDNATPDSQPSSFELNAEISPFTERPLSDSDKYSGLIKNTETGLTSLRAQKQDKVSPITGKLKTGMNILTPTYSSLVLLGLSIADLITTQLIKDSDEEPEVSGLVLSSFNLISTLPITYFNLGYMGFKQNEQIEVAEKQLNNIVNMIRDQELLQEMALKLIADNADSISKENGCTVSHATAQSVGSFVERKYRSSVKHPKFGNYLLMGTMSFAAFAADASAISVNATGNAKTAAWINFAGALALFGSSLYAAAFKVKDASNIRSINNNLEKISEILFYCGNDALTGLCLALDGRFQESSTNIFDQAQLAIQDTDEYPEGFLSLVIATRQEMMSICTQINDLAQVSQNDLEQSNRSLAKGLDGLRKFTASLIKNHVIVANTLDELGAKMPSQLARRFKKNDAVASLSGIAEKLKSSVMSKPNVGEPSERTPLTQSPKKIFNREDVEVINRVQKTVSDQFKIVYSALEQQDKKIEELRDEIKTMKSDHDKEISDMKSDHDKEISDMKSDHDKEINGMKSDHAVETAGLRAEINTLNSEVSALSSKVDNMFFEFRQIIQESNLTINNLRQENTRLTTRLEQQDNQEEQQQEEVSNANSPRFF